MALSLESSSLVSRRAEEFKKGPDEDRIIKTFFKYWAADHVNADLQITYIDGSLTASDSGNVASQVSANAACRLYALYLKKTGTTATWFKLTDHASTATTDGTEGLSYKLTTSGDNTVILIPAGLSLANGLTWTQDTTATGSTLNLLANRLDGFIIIGAP